LIHYKRTIANKIRTDVTLMIMLPDSTGAHCRFLLLEGNKPVLQCIVFCDNRRWQCTINEEDVHEAPIFRNGHASVSDQQWMVLQPV
jgi:hypothetical protein